MSDKIQAVNNFAFISLDEIESESKGLIIPSSGKVKPNKGTIISVGEIIGDKKIKSGKRCIFPKGVGWETDHEGETFLVLEAERIWGVQ